ncbi:hypothetical protein [Pseudomonas sp. 5P_3.1_Bac2]|uniref:hypothetical protein n=1 Tax=Pseudomonas sp. 5P_3.1_Bac2 TaxID=2971617 RepID=UPI0021C736CA|nr:hypothetical protein [Pseudomonas sp. 5P_3.1_Bac2]MCU1718121.1 hypothetical protein [Pseudomonas sp. 5P_3.1_Bac2]
MHGLFLLSVALLLSMFLVFSRQYSVSSVYQSPISYVDRVVVPASILSALYGGDRFLAANIESMRLSATGIENGHVDSDYFIRAQKVVAQLNACHEDNYYLANGLLTWGGAVDEGNDVLKAAVKCRVWDYVPPFFYGVNLAFFQKNIDEAERVLELGAQRSAENAASFRKLAVMLRVEEFSDERLALDYLIQQRNDANDPVLKKMLDKRVVRLEGLVLLRKAQRRYEAERGKLVDLNHLVNKAYLKELPGDPLGLGYELSEGSVILKKMKVAELEKQP